MTDKGSAHDPAGVPPANGSLKSQTSRISLESARPLKAPLEPKKSNGLASNSPAYPGSIPRTIRLKRPPTSPITVQPIDHPPAKKPGETALVQAPTTVRPASPETVKRQTSRIDLTSATAPKTTDFKRSTGPILGIPMHAGPIPQTIRLKRPATATIKRAPTSSIITKTAEPGVMPRTEQPQDITEAPTVIKHVAAPKAPTSRIVLDELAASIAAVKKATSPIAPPTPAVLETPKTIRLKRPSSMSDVEETIQVAGADQSMQAAKKGETAKIELPIAESAQMPMTQRKTIKIKRTDHAYAPAPRPETAGPAAAPKADHLVKAPVPAEAEMIVFPIVAFVATLCIAALVYIMVAQAFGVHLLLPSSMQLH